MVTLTGLNEAERFVTKHKAAGRDVRWDGWDIVFFRAADYGMTSSDGAFRNDTWGFDNRYSVNENGEWLIDGREIRSKKSRV
jgi:hypothetical protein